MSQVYLGRVFSGFPYSPRKRVTMCFGLILSVVITAVVIKVSTSRLQHKNDLEKRVADLQSQLQFLRTQYIERQEEMMILYHRAHNKDLIEQPVDAAKSQTPLSPEVRAILRNITGTHAAAGINPQPLPHLRIPFVLQLLPHLMNDPKSLQPAYHMKGGRNVVDVVIGIPTVRRCKENYLMMTLKHLIDGLTADDVATTLIVVMIGDTDIKYVLNTARKIEVSFGNQVKSGLIEVISPYASYYPNLETLPSTLGDSLKRVMWRSKQNLDAIFLMSYAQSKGIYYLMMEDDVISKYNYMQSIKTFAAVTTLTHPNWFFIEFCQMGGIGKLFKSSELVNFITYVQLFYTNMPIDWLLESYLADRVCTIDKTSKMCGKNKLEIRPQYKPSLFQHIGIYSSLQGKVQRIKNPSYESVYTYSYEAHVPERIRIDVEINTNHTLKKMYRGRKFFMGLKPKQGDKLEFWFQNPTTVEKITFWNGKDNQTSEKFNNTIVEILPNGKRISNFSVVNNTGVAAGEEFHDIGPLDAIRFRVTNNSFHWIVLFEVGSPQNKLKVRPKYDTSLFQHIGFYSSLKGKVQKIKDAHFGSIPTFYPHQNPTLFMLRTTIPVKSNHTLKKAYEGSTFFWGMKPVKGDVIEFWFGRPIIIEKYLFRSGNIDRMSDKFYNTVVEILVGTDTDNFTVSDSFDEFGLAQAVTRDMGPLNAIRIRVTKDSDHWVVLSEIYFKPLDVPQKKEEDRFTDNIWYSIKPN